MSSSGKSDSIRNMYAAFDRHPRLESALEVFFNVVISFAPFLVIAFARSEGKSEMSVFFWSFFSGGEMIIFVFSTCSAVLWLTFFKPHKMKSTISKFFVLIIVMLGLLYAGIIIGDNMGFEENISLYNQSKITSIYLLSLFVWFFVSISNTEDEGGANQDPAKKIDRKYFGAGSE